MAPPIGVSNIGVGVDARHSIFASAPAFNINNLHLLGLREDTTTLLDNAKVSLGVNPDMVHAFPSQTGETWSQVPASINTTLAIYAGRTDVMLEWALPIATATQPLGGVASGAYDNEVRQMFQNISAGVPSSQKVIFCRPGWEMTLNTGPGANWNVTGAAGKGALFIADWIRLVTIGRSVDSRFRFTLCVSNTQTDYTGATYDPFDPVTGCFPPVAYVDVFGQDSYHQTTDFSSSINGANSFDVRSNTEINSLNANYAKAVALGLPFALPEWGVAANDPEIIREYFLWMRGKNIAYHGYWDKNAGTTFICCLSNDQYPLAKAEFTRQAAAPTFVTPASIAVPLGNITVDIEASKGGCVYSIVGGADASSFTLSGNILFGNLSAGAYSVTIRVTDERGLYSDRTFTVTAAANNLQPEVSIANLRSTVAPAAAVLAAQSALVTALKATGYWSKIDELLTPLNDTRQAGLVNLKSSRYDGLAINNPPFRYRGGEHGDGTTSIVDTGLVPNSIGRNFGKNAGFIGVLFLSDLANGASNSVEFGAGTSLYMQRNTNGTVSGRLMCGADIAIGAAKTLPAFIGIARDDVNGGRSFVDGVATAWTQSVARFAYDSLKLHGTGPASAPTGFGVNDIGLVIIGAPPTSAEMTAINAAVQAYKAALLSAPEVAAKRLVMVDAERRDLLTLGTDSVNQVADVIAGKTFTQATSANMPKWLGSGWTNGPGFTFDGNDILVSTADPLVLSGALDIEVWALVQNTEVVSGAPIRTYMQYGGGGFADQIRLSRQAGTGTYISVIGKGSSAVITAAGPGDQGLAKSLVRTIIKPTGVQVEVDGTLGTLAAGVPAIVAGALTIGASPGPANGFIGNVEFIGITQSLTTAEAAVIRQMLLERK